MRITITSLSRCSGGNHFTIGYVLPDNNNEAGVITLSKSDLNGVDIEGLPFTMDARQERLFLRLRTAVLEGKINLDGNLTTIQNAIVGKTYEV